MFLALASPVAMGPLAPGSGDFIEPCTTVIQKYRSETIELLRTKPASLLLADVPCMETFP